MTAYFDKSQLNEVGKCFKQLRIEAGKKGKDFAPTIPTATLSGFEKGEKRLPYEKMVFAAKTLGLELSDFDYLLNGKRIYSRFGEIFNKLRTQRGYGEHSFEKLGVSAYRLKLFEAGRIDLGYSLLDAMLQEIHVTEMDFSHWLNEGKDDYFIYYLKKTEAYSLKDDKEKLKALEQEVLETLEILDVEIKENEALITGDEEDITLEVITKQYEDYRILALGIKSCYTTLNEDEVLEISDFFMGVDFWTELGIAVFAITVKYLSLDLIKSILQEWFRKTNEFEDNYFYRRRIIQAVVETVLYFCIIHQTKMARDVLYFSRRYLKNTDSYASGIYKFAKGFYQYSIGNEEGSNVMKQAISTFAFLDEMALQSKLQKFYDLNVKNRNDLLLNKNGSL